MLKTQQLTHTQTHTRACAHTRTTSFRGILHTNPLLVDTVVLVVLQLLKITAPRSVEGDDGTSWDRGHAKARARTQRHANITQRHVRIPAEIPFQHFSVLHLLLLYPTWYGVLCV